jgi:hypothetical protein
VEVVYVGELYTIQVQFKGDALDRLVDYLDERDRNDDSILLSEVIDRSLNEWLDREMVKDKSKIQGRGQRK